MCWLPAPSEAPHHALVALLLSASEDALRSPGTSPAPVTVCAGTLPASLSCGMVFRNQEGVCAPLLGCHCFQTLSVHRARGKNPQVHTDTSNSNPRSQSAPVASQATLGSCCLPSPSVLLVESDSLRPRGLQPAGLLCPWDSPGRNTQWAAFPPPGDLPDPGIEPASPAWQADSLPLPPTGQLCC